MGKLATIGAVFGGLWAALPQLNWIAQVELFGVLGLALLSALFIRRVRDNLIEILKAIATLKK